MPKDETDPDDPMELRGIELVTEEDTSTVMAECFIEEFMRLGNGAGQILALFRNPHYTGVNRVLQNRGERFVREKIVEVFSWWKQSADFSESPTAPSSLTPTPATGDGSTRKPDGPAAGTVRRPM